MTSQFFKFSDNSLAFEIRNYDTNICIIATNNANNAIYYFIENHRKYDSEMYDKLLIAYRGVTNELHIFILYGEKDNAAILLLIIDNFRAKPTIERIVLKQYNNIGEHHHMKSYS